MFKILISGGDGIDMQSIITDEQLKEVMRLLEASKIYRLEDLHRVDNAVCGEEILEILKQELRFGDLS